MNGLLKRPEILAYAIIAVNWGIGLAACVGLHS